MRDFVHIVIKRLLHIKRLVNIKIYNLALLHTYNAVALALS